VNLSKQKWYSPQAGQYQERDAIMNEREWIEQAEEYERMSQDAYDKGDEIAGELYERKAQSCRFAACNAPIE
jgi:hypothetical protein